MSLSINSATKCNDILLPLRLAIFVIFPHHEFDHARLALGPDMLYFFGIEEAIRPTCITNSDVNKTLLSRPRPRPFYQDQDQGKTFYFKTKTKTKTFLLFLYQNLRSHNFTGY